jgi:hypothetical protein
MGPSYQVDVAGVILNEIAGFSSQHVVLNGFDLIQMPYAIVRDGVVTQSGTESFGEVFTTDTYLFPSNPYEGVGAWLVREINEPPTILCLLIAFLMLLSFLRQNIKNG